MFIGTFLEHEWVPIICIYQPSLSSREGSVPDRELNPDRVLGAASLQYLLGLNFTNFTDKKLVLFNPTRSDPWLKQKRRNAGVTTNNYRIYKRHQHRSALNIRTCSTDRCLFTELQMGIKRMKHNLDSQWTRGRSS